MDYLFFDITAKQMEDPIRMYIIKVKMLHNIYNMHVDKINLYYK